MTIRIVSKQQEPTTRKPFIAQAREARTLIHAYMDRWPNDCEAFESVFQGRRVQTLTYLPLCSSVADLSVWRASFQDDGRGPIPALLFQIEGEQAYQIAPIAFSAKDLGE